jgi:hypothetical protein
LEAPGLRVPPRSKRITTTSTQSRITYDILDGKLCNKIVG